MAKGKFVLAAAAVAAVSLSAFAGTSQAVVYAENPSDAGQTLPTAQGTTSAAGPAGTSLTSITGFLSTSNTDADLYAIRITSPTTFSATTVGNSIVDTQLFLLSSTGVAIATNDDANGTSLQSTLAAGNSLYANLAAGTYFLGISASGFEPVNFNNQLLFAMAPGGDYTTTRGTASGLNPTTEFNFGAASNFLGDTGTYGITLTGAATAVNPAAVPEPSTWAVVGASTAALAFLRRRRVA